MSSSRNRSLKAYGLSDLHLAVIYGRTREIRTLLTGDNRKAMIDARDEDGSTPLMTAVFTGRPGIVRLLLKHGASSKVKDLRGRKAVDYSRLSLQKHKQYVYRRLRLPPVSDRQRPNRILAAKVLRYPAALESCRRAGKQHWSRTVFFKDGEKLRVLKQDMAFKIAKENLERATSGFIASATRPDVKTAATSGWQPNPARGNNVLDNSKYIKLVQDFAQVLKFELTPCFRDHNGKPLPEHSGRFVASHVEKKLAVFWVIAALSGILKTTDIRRMGELRDADVPAAWKQAWIHLDHAPCGNCWGFLAALKRATGIDILVDTRPFLVRGRRERPAGCWNCKCSRCQQTFGNQPVQEQVNPERPPDAHADHGTEAESTAYGDNVAELEPEADTSSDTHAGTDGLVLRGNHGLGSKVRRVSCEPPKKWKRYFSEAAGHYAKPINRRLEKNVVSSSTVHHGGSYLQQLPTQHSDHIEVINAQRSESESTPYSESRAAPISSPSPLDNGMRVRAPASTIVGRSGFFVSPEPRSMVEVLIPRMRPELQDEYSRVSDCSSARLAGERSGAPESVSVGPNTKKAEEKQRRTVQRSAAALNLRRFAYNASEPSTADAMFEMVDRKRDRQMAVASRKVAGRKKFRARMNRDEKLRAKSAFARAVDYHQRRKTGKA